MNVKSIIVNIAFSLLIIHSASAKNNYTQSRVDSKNGLSNSAVLSIYQDNYGLMWFGTYDGLNCYDGHKMDVYRTNAYNSSEQTFLNNIIQGILPAGENNIWIFSSTGINKFSIDQRKVLESYHKFDNTSSLCSNASGDSYLISNDTVYYYNTRHKDFIPINRVEGVILPKSSFVDRDGVLWTFLRDNPQVKRYQVKNFGNDNVDESAVVSTLNFHQKLLRNVYIQEGMLLFIDEDWDLFLYDFERKTTVFIRNIEELIKEQGTIVGIVSVYDDILIAFRENGLVRLEASEKYKDSPVDRNIRIQSMYKDPVQDIVWVGSDGQGVMLYTREHSLATTITFDNLSGNLSRQVRSIFTDDRGNLWFGTKGDGILCIHNYQQFFENQPHKQDVSIYFPEQKQYIDNYKRALSEFQVFAICQSNNFDGFYIGTGGSSPALFYYKYSEDKVKPVQTDCKLLHDIHAISEEGDSILWLTTGSNGLYKVRIRDEGKQVYADSLKQFLFYHQEKEINEFFPLTRDNDSIMWLGSRGKGVIKFNSKRESYIVYNLEKQLKRSNNDILSLYREQDRIYLGTVSGLVMLQTNGEKPDIPKIIGKEQGLLNDMIHGILKDENGFLWLSTNKGLVKYNPVNDSFHSYYYSNGMQIGEFCDDAYYTCPYTGNLFFGGVNGLCYLTPQTVNESEYYPEVYFNKLVLGQENVVFGDYYSKEKHALLLGKGMDVTLGFVAPDFIRGSEYEYSYRLDGSKEYEEWTPFSVKNEAVFKDIASGKYTFKVRYKKDVFDTDHKLYTLPIVVQSPWYITWQACIFYLLIAVTVVAYAFRFSRDWYKREKMLRELKSYEEMYQKSTPMPGLYEQNQALTQIYDQCSSLKEYLKGGQGTKELEQIRQIALDAIFKENNTSSDSFIKKVVHIIEENINNEVLGPAFIAETMAMSSRQFYRKFKEVSGMTPSDFIKNYRLEKAARLLKTTELSIKEIIDTIGISSRSYFHKEFTGKYGKTPKEYRS